MKTFVVIGKKFSGAIQVLKGPSSDFSSLQKFTIGCLENKPDCDIVQLCELQPRKEVRIKLNQKPIVLEPKPFVEDAKVETEPVQNKQKTKSPNKLK